MLRKEPSYISCSKVLPVLELCFLSNQSTKVNSCFGREQLQMLHVGQNSCKCFSYKSKIGSRTLHHQEKGYLHQAMNSQSEQLVVLGENRCKCFTWARTASRKWASAMCVRASLLCSASACSSIWHCAVCFFSTKEQVHTENKMNENMLVLSVKMMLSPRSCK